MSDDIDERIRAAMKVLDDEAPSGYFEALPNVTLSRLEGDIEMQTVNRMTDDASTGIPPQADAVRDEDSGLHDIRSLASSTKLRMSKKMPAVQPVDDDILASSSAGWKAMALPEPAKMISLPELAQLPAASEVKAKDKAARKAEAKQAKADIAEPVVATAAAEVSTAPVIGARFAQQPKSKTGLYAAVGIALAAAAGVGIYLKVSAKSDAPAVVASSEQPTATPIEASASERKAEVAAATPPPVEPAPAPAALAVAQPDVTAPAATSGAVAAQDGESESETEDKRASKRGDKKDKAAGSVTETVAAKPDKAAVEKPAPAAPAAGGNAGEEDPSFDALLKEAGVEKSKDTGPKLDKKSLSSGDIKTAMNGVADKAKGCYSGTEGSATVKLTVAPDGKVSKVKVSGVFAGTPTGACIESAVRGANFPAWDGGPQSVSYSYLLAE